MVVDQTHGGRAFVLPSENEAPLVVDTDAVVAGEVAAQRF
jgi:hypothetical protein